MLAAAFHDDPVITYLFPEAAERRRRAPALFAILYDGDGAHGARYATPGGEAATLWREPGRERLGLGEMIAEALPWVRAAGPALGRALVFSAKSDAAHPKRPHWYLHVAGCAPEHQSRGYGRAVIAAGLRRADAAGMPSYLETATPRNVPYYESFGFAVTHEWSIGDAVPVWSMLRPPHRDTTG